MTIELEKVVTIKFKNCEINGNSLVNKTLRSIFVELGSSRVNIMLNGSNNVRMINLEESLDYEIGITNIPREQFNMLSFVIKRYYYKFLCGIIGKLTKQTNKDEYELELVDVHITNYE